ncbi:MAG: hypothetical protein ACYTEK_15660 [Planctomycetota bacterium]|jgi:hypothetical protein
MFIYSTLIGVTLYFVTLAIDITVFFLIVRAVTLWKEISWLKPFNEAGKTLVDDYTLFVGRLWTRIAHRCLAPKGRLLIGLVMLELVRFFLFSVARFFL